MNVLDGQITFDLTDDRSLLLRTLPPRTYNNNGGTDAYTQPDRGRSRALLWGTKTGIRPVQYDIAYPGGGPVPMGLYEVVDTTDWSPGLKDINDVFWYADDQAATARSASKRNDVYTGLGAAGSVTAYPLTGRFAVLHDTRPIFITDENNKLYFDIGGAVLCAVIPVGVYGGVDTGMPDPQGLDITITAQMQSVSGAGDVFCSFTESTQKFAIGKSAGTLNLRCATGSDTQSGIWALLGFNASADKTGSLLYNADNVFTSQAYDQILRADVIGFKDDASGTYTGTASATIEKAPDIARHILQAFLKVPESQIDIASFVAARATTWGAKPCSLYIGVTRTVADVFSELETSGHFDLIVSGGLWTCVPRDTTVPAGTPTLEDADYIAFESYYNPDDIFGTVTLTYNEAPDGGDPLNISKGRGFGQPNARTEMGEVTDPDVELRFDRREQTTFRTCLRDAADACYPLAGSRLEGLAAECSTPRRRFRLTVKGKALLTPIGGKLVLTRSRGVDSTGALSSVLVRVISKRDDWARWISEIEAIEVV